jgi:hypothetical protein
MVKPTEYEDLNQSIILIGYDIINILKKKNYNIEDLFNETKKKKQINLNQFYNTLTFLWLSGIIIYDKYFIKLTT